MDRGLIFLLIAVLGSGGLGVLYKYSQRLGYRPDVMTMLLFFWGAAFTAGYFLATGANLRGFSPKIAGIAIGASALSTLAVTMYQKAFNYGKVAPSALVLNFSMIVPFILSIIVFDEKVKPQQLVALLLMCVSLVCLWWDKALQDRNHGQVPVPATPAAVTSVRDAAE
jgi:drug/metabolite transporter (DMT)-like permease